MYQDQGHECHVNKTNSVLGLTMYFSYFVLFGKLFVDNYVTQTRKRPRGVVERQRSFAELSRKVTRRMTSRITPQMDGDDSEDTGSDPDLKGKKVN
mmetsp:Transcript_19263/g.57642  ORF Transcript_19263/g.57642 Transcript_19263/m.57642 type:complete len:96 (-) Transcript_19263:285-572(-)